jgi:hypothetical protein
MIMNWSLITSFLGARQPRDHPPDLDHGIPGVWPRLSADREAPQS